MRFEIQKFVGSFFKKELLTSLSGMHKRKSPKPRIVVAIVCGLGIAAAPIVAKAQAIAVELPNVMGPPAGVSLNAEQLDRLVAPVALYPDPLLTDILAAATYPAQIVEAQRFVADPARAGLPGDALMEAGTGHDWDASVLALLPFRQVLALLDTRLEWTDRLGRAFLAQPDDVLNAVQRLRRRAQDAGNLVGGLQDGVTEDGGAIAILPPSPQTMSVPSYDPACVYGADDGCGGATSIAWDDGVFLPFGYGQWGEVNWRDRRIHCRVGGPDGHVVGTMPDGDAAARATGAVWRHDDSHADPARMREAAAQYQYAPPAGERIGPAAGAPRHDLGDFRTTGRLPGGFRGAGPAGAKGPAFHAFAGHVAPPGARLGPGNGRR
jgi:hypothetical protein